MNALKMNIQNNYQYFMNINVDKFIGEWIAICDERIVAHGKCFKDVFKEAKEKCAPKRPMITKVPDKETMIF